jgi:hypothetical protein
MVITTLLAATLIAQTPFCDAMKTTDSRVVISERLATALGNAGRRWTVSAFATGSISHDEFARPTSSFVDEADNTTNEYTEFRGMHTGLRFRAPLGHPRRQLTLTVGPRFGDARQTGGTSNPSTTRTRMEAELFIPVWPPLRDFSPDLARLSEATRFPARYAEYAEGLAAGAFITRVLPAWRERLSEMKTLQTGLAILADSGEVATHDRVEGDAMVGMQELMITTYHSELMGLRVPTVHLPVLPRTIPAVDSVAAPALRHSRLMEAQAEDFIRERYGPTVVLSGNYRNDISHDQRNLQPLERWRVQVAAEVPLVPGMEADLERLNLLKEETAKTLLDIETLISVLPVMYEAKRMRAERMSSQVELARIGVREARIRVDHGESPLLLLRALLALTRSEETEMSSYLQTLSYYTLSLAELGVTQNTIAEMFR